MPDSRAARDTDAARALRDRMFRERPHTPERASAAHQLLEAILGGAGDPRPLDPRVKGPAPQSILDVVEWFRQRFPAAGQRVGSVGVFEQSGVGGLFNPSTRYLGVNPRENTTPGALKNTLHHEMAHAVGLSDKWSEAPMSPVSAYDVGRAAEIAREDINLPKEAVLRLLVRGAK
jgi:hypothetical protein